MIHIKYLKLVCKVPSFSEITFIHENYQIKTFNNFMCITLTENTT